VKKAFSILLAAVVTVGALVYALWGVDWAVLGELLAGVRVWVLAPFWVFLVLFYVFNALRWNLILRRLGRYSLRESGPAMMIGFAGNNVLPAHLGELVRAVVFARQTGLPASGVLTTLIVERIFDVFSILFFYFMALWLIDPFPESIRLGAEAIAGAMAVVCAGIIAFLAFPHTFVTLWERLSNPLPTSLRDKGSRLLRNAEAGLSALKSPAMLAGMIAHSLLRWGSCGAMVWLALLGFGVTISFPVSMIVIAVSAVAVTVPSAPGFFGAMQAAFVFALLPFGISREVALAASVLYLVAQWLPVTLFGAWCFTALGLDARTVRAEAEKLEEEA